MCPKERDHVRIELPEESRAVEAWLVGANVWPPLNQQRRAKDEDEMPAPGSVAGVSHDPILVRRQCLLNCIHLVARPATFGCPQLYWHRDRCETLGIEKCGTRVGE